MAKPGEIKASRAARILECNIVTVRRWARDWLEGNPSHLTWARQLASGHYRVLLQDIQRIKNELERVR